MQMVPPVCRRCRHRHLKCDGAIPCAQCKSTGVRCPGYGATSGAGATISSQSKVDPAAAAGIVGDRSGGGAGGSGTLTRSRSPDLVPAERRLSSGSSSGNIAFDPIPSAYKEAQIIFDGISYCWSFFSDLFSFPPPSLPPPPSLLSLFLPFAMDETQPLSHACITHARALPVALLSYIELSARYHCMLLTVG